MRAHTRSNPASESNSPATSISSISEGTRSGSDFPHSLKDTTSTSCGLLLGYSEACHAAIPADRDLGVAYIYILNCVYSLKLPIDASELTKSPANLIRLPEGVQVPYASHIRPFDTSQSVAFLPFPKLSTILETKICEYQGDMNYWSLIVSNFRDDDILTSLDNMIAGIVRNTTRREITVRGGQVFYYLRKDNGAPVLNVVSEISSQQIVDGLKQDLWKNEFSYMNSDTFTTRFHSVVSPPYTRESWTLDGRYTVWLNFRNLCSNGPHPLYLRSRVVRMLNHEDLGKCKTGGSDLEVCFRPVVKSVGI